MSRSPPRRQHARKNISIPAASGQPGGRPAPAFLGDLQMRIARDGTWFYRGSPILRKPLVKLFSSVLQRDEAGAYWLVTPVERGRVEVEDVPFTAVELSRQGEGTGQVLRFRTNLDEWVSAGPAHPIRVATARETGEPSPYLLIRGRLEALIVRSVFYELAELAVEERLQETAGDATGEATGLGIWSEGVFFQLGSSS